GRGRVAAAGGAEGVDRPVRGLAARVPVVRAFDVRGEAVRDVVFRGFEVRGVDFRDVEVRALDAREVEVRDRSEVDERVGRAFLGSAGSFGCWVSGIAQNR
ncbi:MAG: hypothetical protein WCF24_09700, partial [Acidimicrobiales bacterium]